MKFALEILTQKLGTHVERRGADLIVLGPLVLGSSLPTMLILKIDAVSG